MNGQTALTEIAPDARIGIIGAGVSGLTTAHYLAQAGYENVLLFEKRDQVGGKCDSIVVDGRVYEMGAVFGAANYKVIGELASHVGVAEAVGPAHRCYTRRGRRTALLPKQMSPFLLWRLFAKLAWLTAKKYRDIYQPGLAGIHPDLYESFATFSERHGVPELPALFQPTTTAFGYGYPEQVPAAYMLKYLCWSMIMACARGKGSVWPEGIQTVWQRLAFEQDVRLGVDIERVVRGENVVVETAETGVVLDYLILACPLDNALSFLDATAEERDLFSRIRHTDYWVLLCEIEGLPHDIGYLPANFALENQGHFMLWYCRRPQTRLYTLYLLGDFQTSQDVIEATCAADLQRLGARLVKVRAARRWRYFPHVGTADMADGYYERLEGMQGQRRTYYCGEIMSFSTLECSARYARELVDRFFHPVSSECRRSYEISAIRAKL